MSKKGWKFDDKGRLIIKVTTDKERIKIHEFNKRNLDWDDKKHAIISARSVVFQGLTKQWHPNPQKGKKRPVQLISSKEEVQNFDSLSACARFLEVDHKTVYYHLLKSTRIQGFKIQEVQNG